MKKLTAVLLALGVGLGLGACGQPFDPENGDDEALCVAFTKTVGKANDKFEGDEYWAEEDSRVFLADAIAKDKFTPEDEVLGEARRQIMKNTDDRFAFNGGLNVLSVRCQVLSDPEWKGYEWTDGIDYVGEFGVNGYDGE